MHGVGGSSFDLYHLCITASSACVCNFAPYISLNVSVYSIF